jgi:uncharacterized coiled-coil DUF342 family protein
MNDDDYEKEFDRKINKEIERFKKIKTLNDKFREVYQWIDSLIDICKDLQGRIELLEKDINEIKKEMANDKS